MDDHHASFARGVCAIALLSFLTMGCLGPLDSWLGIDSHEQDQADRIKEQTNVDVPAETPTESTESGEVMEYAPDERVLIWKAGNDGGIEGGGGTPPQVTHDRDYYVVEIATYHSGYGADAPDPSGTISLKAGDGTVYGPYETTVQNAAYWVAVPNEVIPAGTYTLIDSDPGTWAQNSGSGGTGMGWAYGVIPE